MRTLSFAARVVVPLEVVVALLLAARLLPVESWQRGLEGRLDGLGLLAPVLYAVLYALGVVAFVPGSLFTMGAGLLARLREEVPRFREVPVIMPVSVFARLAFEGAWKARPLRHVLPLLEDAIDEQVTRRAIHRFLSATSPRRAEGFAG